MIFYFKLSKINIIFPDIFMIISQEKLKFENIFMDPIIRMNLDSSESKEKYS